MNYFYYLVIALIVALVIGFNIFIYLLDKKIKKLEKIILKLFEDRSNLIPSLYEVTKKYLSKHDEVFSEILKLRKKYLSKSDESFQKQVNDEIYIHHELNFIFKVANKHQKIQKDSKFLLVRDLFLENSFEIGKKMNLYKEIVKKFNNVV
jgi:hypothetical protein